MSSKKSKLEIEQIEVIDPEYLGKTIDEVYLSKKRSEFPRGHIKSSKDCFNYIRQFYGEDINIYESVFILCLSNSNETIGFAKISQGGIRGTIVDIRLIAKIALDTLAVSVILAHNHPSGTLKPSEADKSLTRKLENGLATLDIKLLDHIILTDKAYYSFADENQLLKH